MKKLWKVKVNAWGWDCPRTIYAVSREAAEEIAERYPAADPVEYAGNFTDIKAKMLLDYGILIGNNDDDYRTWYDE